MYIAIFFLLYKIRMLLKVIITRMFQNEVCSRMKDILCKNLIGNCGQILKCIWGIGKNYIKLLPADFKKLKHIMPHHGEIAKSEPGSLKLDEVGMEGKHLDTVDHRSSA